MIEGVTKGFRKSLEIQGVGYRAAKAGEKLNFTLGYSHPGRLRGAEGHHDLGRRHEQSPRRRHRQAKRRPGRGGDSRAASARAVQGQRHSLRRRSRPQEARQGRKGRQEVMARSKTRRSAQARHDSPAQESRRDGRAAAPAGAPHAAPHLRDRRRRREGPHARRGVDAREVAGRGPRVAHERRRGQGRRHGDRGEGESCRHHRRGLRSRRVPSITAASRRWPMRRAKRG